LTVLFDVFMIQQHHLLKGKHNMKSDRKSEVKSDENEENENKKTEGQDEL